MSISPDAIPRLIELGRWAPSGDNTQPWRFEVIAPDNFVIHGFDTRTHCVYDLDGHPSQIAIGALIETLHIAASEQSLQLDVSRRRDAPDTIPTFDVRLSTAEGRRPDPLLSAIPRRSVNRSAYSTRPLTATEIHTLESSLPAGYSLRWYASAAQRWQLARLMFANAKLRLTMQEAYEVHRSVIDWDARFSADRVPDAALGLDAMTLKLMRWALADWKRVHFLNQWLAGTVMPRLQMDFIPSLRCAAHVALVAASPLSNVDDYVAAGRAVQRFWLTATSLNLQHQPELTPLIFCRYVHEEREFTREPFLRQLGAKLAQLTDASLELPSARVAWLGRLGAGTPASARSVRRAVSQMVQRHS
ncbi:molybdopterin biosynthesis protein MoeY [Ideonella sp. DXS22W]|uniref:Molybdopterin biosynthesis protein MoeY n=1 Tax=Pseudaquabacterium inlustre TaxID=2984192 RepID=A0ABU9CNC1_9BURK